jgi:hypothetical protein
LETQKKRTETMSRRINKDNLIRNSLRERIGIKGKYVKKKLKLDIC